jgi:hypothetical protein
MLFYFRTACLCVSVSMLGLALVGCAPTGSSMGMNGGKMDDKMSGKMDNKMDNKK